MNDKKTSKSAMLKSITKMVTDKDEVRSYMKGEKDLESINKKGIKLAKPI